MNQIKMPGVGFLCSAHSEVETLRLSPDFLLEERGVGWFFKNRVAPQVRQGVTHLLFHGWAGNFVEHGPNPLSNTGDMAWGMRVRAEKHPNPKIREHAESMKNHLLSLASSGRLTIDLYLGTPRCPTMNNLYTSGQIEEWNEATFASIKPFMNCDNVRFIIDAIGSPLTHEDSPHWKLYKMLELTLGEHRVSMESFPRPEQQFKHQWHKRSAALEHHAQKYIDHHGRSALGSDVLRFFSSRHFIQQLKPTEPAPVWPTSRGGLPAFLLDGHLNGDTCVIADHVLKSQFTTITKVWEKAQALLDSRRVS